VIEPRKDAKVLVADAVGQERKAKPIRALTRVLRGTSAVGERGMQTKLLAREPGDLTVARRCNADEPQSEG